MQNWNCFLEQAKITINLLCPSRLNPKISSYAHLNVKFDYNRTTMDLPGTRTLVHEEQNNRGTYLGTRIRHNESLPSTKDTHNPIPIGCSDTCGDEGHRGAT